MSYQLIHIFTLTFYLVLNKQEYSSEGDISVCMKCIFFLEKKTMFLKLSLLSQTIRLILSFDLETKIVSFVKSVAFQYLSKGYIFISKYLVSQNLISYVLRWNINSNSR